MGLYEYNSCFSLDFILFRITDFHYPFVIVIKFATVYGSEIKMEFTLYVIPYENRLCAKEDLIYVSA